jgi:cyclopropane fatty-acyl-phospholipid synthase-like methyltransferase
MNKYVFPDTEASCSLGWVIRQVEAAGFEVKNIDVLGVHYRATIRRWYLNLVQNKEKVCVLSPAPSRLLRHSLL